MKVKLVDPMPFHPTLCYPGTDRPLQAVGLSRSGLPLWPLLGADDGDDADDEDASEEDEDGDSDEGDDADDSQGDDDKGKKSKKKSGPVSREEFDAVTRRLSAADKRRSDAEKEAAALKKEKEDKEREGKPELENLRKDHDELVKNNEGLQNRFRKLALVNAFLTASAQEKIAWHDPKVAQKAADLEDLEVDEDGNVEGIRDAVKLLAKSHKYLVNSGKEDGDEGDGKEERRRGASGSGVGSTKTSKGKKATGQLSREELIKRFPALKTR